MTVISIEHIALRDNGAPYVAGKGVKVAYIANLYMNHRWSVEAIADQHDLTPAEVHSALAYYHDHKDEIDRAVREGSELARQVGTSFDDLRRQIEERQHGKTE